MGVVNSDEVASIVKVIETEVAAILAATKAANEFDANDVLSIKDASRLIHIHEVTIRRMIAQGEFPAHKIASFYYIYRPELKKWFLDHGNK